MGAKLKNCGVLVSPQINHFQCFTYYSYWANGGVLVSPKISHLKGFTYFWKFQTPILDSGCVKNNLKNIGKKPYFKQQYDVVHSYYTFWREVTWHRDLRQNTKCKKRPLGHKAHFWFEEKEKEEPNINNDAKLIM